MKPVDVLFDSDLANDSGDIYVGGSRDSPNFNLFPALSDVKGVSLIYANVPFTYYVIDSTNNKFTFQVDGGGDTLITIPPGTYNSITIASTLENIIRANVTLTEDSASKGFYCYVDSTTGKLTFQNQTDTNDDTLASGYTIKFDQTESPHKILGFDPTTYTATYVAGTTDDTDVPINSYVLTGERTVNLTGPAQMFLNSDLGSAIYGSVRNQSNFKGLLGFWPVNANYQGTIEYVREDPPIIPMSKTSISKINLSLTLGNRERYSNLNGQVNPYLQLNGEAFQVGLRFWLDNAGSEAEHNDSMGNAVMSAGGGHQSSVYKPKKQLKRVVR